VRLHVLEFHPLVGGGGGDRDDLFENQPFEIERSHVHFATAEPLAIVEPWMDADGTAWVRASRTVSRIDADRQRERRQRADRGHDAHQIRVGRRHVCRCFSDVSVQIDPHRDRSDGWQVGTSAGTKQKGTAESDAPLLLLTWLPQHSRRPAVIRSATPALIASGMPASVGGFAGDFERKGIRP